LYLPDIAGLAGIESIGPAEMPAEPPTPGHGVPDEGSDASDFLLLLLGELGGTILGQLLAAQEHSVETVIGTASPEGEPQGEPPPALPPPPSGVPSVEPDGPAAGSPNPWWSRLPAGPTIALAVPEVSDSAVVMKLAQAFPSAIEVSDPAAVMKLAQAFPSATEVSDPAAVMKLVQAISSVPEGENSVQGRLLQLVAGLAEKAPAGESAPQPVTGEALAALLSGEVNPSLQEGGDLAPPALARAVALVQQAERVVLEGVPFSKALQEASPDVPRGVGEGAPRTLPVPPGQAAQSEVSQTSQMPRTASVERTWTTLSNVGDTIVRSVRFLASRGEQTFTVRLVPESLGEVRIDVTRSQDAISVRLAAVNPMVREMLDGQTSALRHTLAQDGLELGRVTVTVDLGAGQMDSRPPPAPYGQPSPPGETRPAYSTAESTPEATARGAPRHDGALNVYA